MPTKPKRKTKPGDWRRRSRKPETTKRAARTTFRHTLAQDEELKAAAAAANMTVSDYVVFRLFS